MPTQGERYRAIFSGPAGEAVLKEWIQIHLLDVGTSGDALRDAFDSGMRSFVADIVNEMGERKIPIMLEASGVTEGVTDE